MDGRTLRVGSFFSYDLTLCLTIVKVKGVMPMIPSNVVEVFYYNKFVSNSIQFTSRFWRDCFISFFYFSSFC